ncbi:hypothetical protein AgCh_004258 [Apium graveolens]
MLLRKSKITIDKSVQTMYSGEGFVGFKKMTLKIWVQKSSRMILFAHCTEEFIDFLFSLLTVPLGRVISVLNKDDGLASCVRNMRRSISGLSVGEHLRSQYYRLTSYSDSAVSELKLASQMGEGGYLKGSAKFMVTDDLVVTPFSSMSCVNYVHGHKIPSGDIVEQMINIGTQEVRNTV